MLHVIPHHFKIKRELPISIIMEFIQFFYIIFLILLTYVNNNYQIRCEPFTFLAILFKCILISS